MLNITGIRRFLAGLLPILLILLPADHQQTSDGPCTECCTSLLVGPEASVDGSTMTGHSCDSGTDRTWISLEPRKTHPSGTGACSECSGGNSNSG